MQIDNRIAAPEPVLDQREREYLAQLQKRYERLCRPGVLARAGKAVSRAVPAPVRKLGKQAGEKLTEQKLFTQMLGVLNEGFRMLEETASRCAIPREDVIRRADRACAGNRIRDIEDICLARGYEISGLVRAFRTRDMLLAFGEGTGTGAMGLWGLPFSLTISLFLAYRAVQTVAMFYGYDVQKDAGELLLAGEVFTNALSPGAGKEDEMGGTISRFMAIAEGETLKHAVKKSYAEISSRGAAELLLQQLRALAKRSAKTSLEEAGEKGVEKLAFRRIFEQLGETISRKAAGRTVPLLSAAIGGVFDLAQMKAVVSYADVFYCKRFLLEKEERVQRLLEQREQAERENAFPAE